MLFDRKMLRNFRKDGHNWKKKKDGKTVKEAHEHLKVWFSHVLVAKIVQMSLICSSKLFEKNFLCNVRSININLKFLGPLYLLIILVLS